MDIGETLFVGKCYLKKNLDHNLSLVRKNSQQISLCLGVGIKAMNCNVCNSSPWKDLRLFGERGSGTNELPTLDSL